MKVFRGRHVRVYKTVFRSGADYRKSVFCALHEERAAFYLGRAGDFRLTTSRTALIEDPDYEYDSRAISNKFTRAILFERARARCQECRKRLKWKALPKVWEVDHVIPIFRGGKTKLSNLVVLCAACHKIKSSEEKSEVAKTRWAARGRVTRWMTHYEKDRLVESLRLEIVALKARLSGVSTEINDESEPVLEHGGISSSGT